MTSWKQVRWTEASQVAALLGWPKSEGVGVTPADYFRTLREQGRDPEAALFLGQALPRFECVTWAARTVRDHSPPEATQADADALKSAFLWLQDPTDNRRRAAFEAAGKATEGGPQALCAMAVFFSGGSMAPENLQPVPAPKDAAGKLAAGAVLSAAAAGDDRRAILDAAFALGESLASGVDAAQP
jgi:hypothetical protein